MDEKTKKVLFHLIDSKTKGVDTYHHNGSMWLIFTDQKKWVIELSKDGTLWYNHYFFKDCFKYLSLDVVENQHYITEWVEDIIQNGVKEIIPGGYLGFTEIRGKVIHQFESPTQNNQVEDVIENGIKETWGYERQPQTRVNNVIRTGKKFDTQ